MLFVVQKSEQHAYKFRIKPVAPICRISFHVVSYFAHMKTTVVFAGKGSLNGAACPDVQRR